MFKWRDTENTTLIKENIDTFNNNQNKTIEETFCVALQHLP